MAERAKPFRAGGSRAVRLSKKHRSGPQEVSVRRDGTRVVLEPVRRRAWPKEYWKSWKKVPDDFEAPAPLPHRLEPVDLDGP